MKKLVIISFILTLFMACGSQRSFQKFFNNHKSDLGATAFQVPNFMRALITSISPEVNDLLGNVNDFKLITFSNISSVKQRQLLQEINSVTQSKFIDVLRKNSIEKTTIISVLEKGDVVTQAVVFSSTLEKTTVFYLKGRFNPNRIKELSEGNQFEDLSTKLLQNYNSESLK